MPSIKLGGYFDIARKETRVREIEKLESDDQFWSDTQKAQTLSKEKNGYQQFLDFLKQTAKLAEDCETWIEIAAEDPTQVDSFYQDLLLFEGNVTKIRVEQMLSRENDKADAIVSINAGAGGTEAQDWAQMLLRMYIRYCEQRGYKTQIVDTLVGEEAGIKSATFMVEGPYAFGYLSAEIGVHRLVRISPFDSNARRHTSFASVFVYPDIEKDIEIEIQDKDIRVDTFRAGGAGGQKVNKTDSAVRITHAPSGIVVSCQNERSQHQNRAMAMKILKARLYEREVEMKNKEKQVVEDSKMDIAWGSQIRSYVLAPYRLIKDHRTNYEHGDVQTVLDGNIQGFIESFLMQRTK